MRVLPKDTNIQSISKFRVQRQNSKLRAPFPQTASFTPSLYPSGIYHSWALKPLKHTDTAGQDGMGVPKAGESWFVFSGCDKQ